METLERNRVFSIGEIENLKKNTNDLMLQAIEISGNFNGMVEELSALAGRIPPEAGNVLSGVLAGYRKDFVYGDYEELRNCSERLFGKLIAEIPQKDTDTAKIFSEIKVNVFKTGQTVDSLRFLLAPGTMNLSFVGFCRRADRILTQNTVLTEKEKMEKAVQKLGYVPSCTYGNDPVNLITGNFLLQETDLQISGIPFLKFERFYDSLNRKKGIFGRGWRTNLDIFRDMYENTQSKDYKTDNGSIIFDESGNIAEIVSDIGRKFRFLYEGDHLVGVSDDRGRKITYEYENNKLSAVIDPMGHRCSYRYGKSGRIEKIIDACGRIIIENQYDDLKRVSCQLLPDGRKIQYIYPSEEKYTEIIFPDGHITRYHYDDMLNRYKTTDENNCPIYDLSGYRYQDRIKALKVQSEYETDEQGKAVRLIRGRTWDEIHYGSNGCPDRICLGEGGQFSFIYDDCNRIAIKTDGNGNTRKYEYDLCDRLTAISYPDGTRACYEYDASGRLTHLTQNTGREYAIQYDKIGRMTHITEQDTRLEFIYDEAGNVSRMITQDGKEIHCDKAGIEKMLSALTTNIEIEQPVQEDHDRAGNIVRQRFRDGREFIYEYDCMNRVVRLVQNGKSEFLFCYENGRCVKKTDPTGQETCYQYDGYGRLQSLTDGMGNVFSMTQMKEMTGDVNNEAERRPDFSVEVTDEIAQTGVTEIRDECGRLIRRTFADIISCYEYNTGYQISRIVHKQKEEILEELVYQYDRNDNCVAVDKYRRDCPADSGCFTYEYDALGRLQTVRKDGAVQAEYGYDSLGNRTKKKEQNRDHRYSYDKRNILCYTDVKETRLPKEDVRITCRRESEEKKEYMVQKEGHSYRVVYRELPEAVLEDGTVRYLLTDHLGSVLRVIREDGSTESIHSYDEFGVAKESQPEYAGYAGYIPVTKDIYATESRYYIPELGRFMTKDSWKGNPGNPQTWNQWIYVLNNPMRYKDASGYSPAEVFKSGLSTTVQADAGEYAAGCMLEALASCSGTGVKTDAGFREFRLEWTGSNLGNLMDMSLQGGSLNNLQLVALTNPSLAEAVYGDNALTGDMSYRQSYSRLSQNLGIQLINNCIAYMNGAILTEADKILNGQKSDSWQAADIAMEMTSKLNSVMDRWPKAKMKDLKAENTKRKEEKIELWSDPEYVLSKEERKEAKEIVNDYYKNKYSRNMDSEAYEEFCKIVMIENKTRVGAGVLAGFFESIPLWDLMEKGTDKGFAWAEEQSGGEIGYTFSEQIDIIEKQFPTATKVGEGAGYILQFLALRGILAEGKTGKALEKAGEGMIAKMGLEGAAKAAAQKTAKSMVNVTLDTMVDTLLKTIPHAIVNGIDGKSAEEIAKEALAETGESFAYNITGEVLAVMVENIAKGILKDKKFPNNLDDTCKGESDTLEDVVEGGTDALEDVVEGGTDALNNLKPQNLMDELASSGVKYNPDEVIAVTKTADGKLLWLEQGNTKSGLTHILERHADDFASQGIDDIPLLLNDVLKTAPIKAGSNSKGLFADYVFNGNTYRVAYGTNGYIVSFYPID